MFYCVNNTYFVCGIRRSLLTALHINNVQRQFKVILDCIAQILFRLYFEKVCRLVCNQFEGLSIFF